MLLHRRLKSEECLLIATEQTDLRKARALQVGTGLTACRVYVARFVHRQAKSLTVIAQKFTKWIYKDV